MPISRLSSACEERTHHDRCRTARRRSATAHGAAACRAVDRASKFLVAPLPSFCRPRSVSVDMWISRTMVKFYRGFACLKRGWLAPRGAFFMPGDIRWLFQDQSTGPCTIRRAARSRFGSCVSLWTSSAPCGNACHRNLAPDTPTTACGFGSSCGNARRTIAASS